MKKKPEELLRLARNALERAGARPGMAAATAEHLVRAEEHGLPTHGMSRVPFYCGFLKNARADGAAEPVMAADKAELHGVPMPQPSEAARAVGGEDWRPLMEPTRRAARRLVAAGDLVITQGGRVVDPSTAKGPIRLRLA